MKIHCLEHLKNETLGSIGTWITQKQHSLTKTLLYNEDFSEEPHFPNPEDFDLLLIMGGSMSVWEEAEYPWLKPEKKFVKEVIKSGKPILGSCFGGQIIAEVLGAKVTKNKYKEIGWHEVKLVIPSRIEKKESLELPTCFFSEFKAFMWHGDTFEIPAGAIKLFESEACANQGYLYNGNILGLQFHPEADKQWVKNQIEESSHELISDKYIQAADAICRQKTSFEEAKKVSFTIMDWFEKIVYEGRE
jgi:GMP synthase-like glutamine amidotransferase